MQIEQQRKGAVTIVRPQGPMTKDDADEFKQRLLTLMRDQLGRVVLDASAMPFVDSRGLEVMVEVNNELSQSGQVLKVCGLTETLRDVLRLTDLTSVFEHFEDHHAAVRSFL